MESGPVPGFIRALARKNPMLHLTTDDGLMLFYEETGARCRVAMANQLPAEELG
jgi:hypothetical protein